jgi:predicted nucleotidyltransferase
MDIEDLLKLLNEHKVKFVIIGAAAFPVHGYARATLDTDIFIAPTKLNATKCLAALRDFGYDVGQITEKDLLKKKILLRQYLVEVDIHPYVKGVTFRSIWKNRVKDKIGSAAAYFVSLDDLIRMKRAAGRAKDREDLKVLLKLQKTRKTKKR